MIKNRLLARLTVAYINMLFMIHIVRNVDNTHLDRKNMLIYICHC